MNVVEFLEAQRPNMQRDISTYAPDRIRQWVGCEASLTKAGGFHPVPRQFNYSSEIWAEIRRICNENGFEPEVALIHYGDAQCPDPTEQILEKGCGISWHADHFSLSAQACVYNFQGTCLFGLHRADATTNFSPTIWRDGLDAEPTWHTIEEHEFMFFNSKCKHRAFSGPNRWAFNAWQISKRSSYAHKLYVARYCQ